MCLKTHLVTNAINLFKAVIFDVIVVLNDQLIFLDVVRGLIGSFHWRRLFFIFLVLLFRLLCCFGWRGWLSWLAFSRIDLEQIFIWIVAFVFERLRKTKQVTDMEATWRKLKTHSSGCGCQ